MGNTRYYNMHNILEFQINSENWGSLLKDINYPFSYFETSSINDDPDIILNIGKFAPSKSNCNIVDHKYYIKDNYFYCRDQDGRAKWEVEIYGFSQGRVIINFHSRIIGIEHFIIPDYLAQNLILRPIIELKLLEKGYVAIHGLGLEKDGKAIIFPARGGAHKTRTVMESVKNHRFRIFGDDRLIIGKNELFCYPLFLNTLCFRVRYLKNEHIPNFFGKILLFKYLNGKKDDYNQIIAQNGKLIGTYFICKKKDNKIINIHDISLENALKKMQISNQREFDIPLDIAMLSSIHFLKYMYAYSFVYPNSQIARYYFQLTKTLSDYFSTIPIKEIFLPEKFSPELINYYEGLFGKNEELCFDYSNNE